MRRNLIESVMGAVVLLVAALFVYFAYHTAQVRSAPGYPITAIFGKIGGLAVGSDVRISGVKIGNVTARALDPQTYAAIVTMTIEDGVTLPEDTIASIASEGPLGGRYVRLEPGTSATALAPGETIKQTRVSSLS